MLPECLLRLPIVLSVTALSRSGLYDLIARGEFPGQIRIGQRAVAWRASEVAAWIASRQSVEG